MFVKRVLLPFEKLLLVLDLRVLGGLLSFRTFKALYFVVL